MDIIVCPLFFDNNEIINDVYCSDNTIIKNCTLNNLPKANNIYILINSNFVSIWKDIKLPPISSSKINNALYSLLEDNLLVTNNIFSYDKNLKMASAIEENLLKTLISKTLKYKSKVFIAPMAIYFNKNEGIIQSYEMGNNKVNIYTYNSDKSYGITLLNTTLDNDEIKLHNVIPDYIWENTKKYKILNFKIHQNSEFKINKYAPLWLFFITLFTVIGHMVTMQYLVMKTNKEYRIQNKKVEQEFHSILPNQPMLDPIAQLKKSETQDKKDIALEKLDKLSGFLSKYNLDIKELFYDNNLWQVKLNHENNVSKMVNDANSMGIIIEENNDIWQLSTN